MTTEQIIAFSKEILAKEITEQEAQDYIEGETAIPEEKLDIVSGGDGCAYDQPLCSVCNQPLSVGGYSLLYCNNPECSQYHKI